MAAKTGSKLMAYAPPKTGIEPTIGSVSLHLEIPGGHEMRIEDGI